MDAKLRPSGVVVVGDQAPAVSRPDPLFALKLRKEMVPERVVAALARIFRPFYWVPVMVVALTGFVFLDVWIAVHNGPTRLTNSAYALIDRPGLTLLVMALLVVAGAFHECGHVTACRYGGPAPPAWAWAGHVQ